MSDREPSGGDLLLLERFINTLDIEEVADRVASPAAMADWLEAEGQGRVAIDADGHARALALREALRRLALANNGGTLYPVDLGTLNQIASQVRLRPRFGPAGARLEPDAEGLDAVLGRWVAAVYAAMADGSWQRLKACRMHTCRWVFVDESRNGARTWCSMKSCGNREKVRRFRERASTSV